MKWNKKDAGGKNLISHYKFEQERSGLEKPHQNDLPEKTR